jgi:hypothetical protein
MTTPLPRRRSRSVATRLTGLGPCLAALAGLSSPAAATDFDNLQLLDQGQFRALSEDLGAAISFKPMIPSESLGLTGIDLGFGISATRLENRGTWSSASEDDVPEYLPIPTLRVHKGLPFNLDIGATYAAIPDTDIKLWGAEARWAFIEGNAVVPSVAVRASMSRLSGVDQLGARTRSVDLSISKGFLMLTPYAGFGRVWVKTTPHAGNLGGESFGLSKVFGGLNINLGLVNLAVEADRTGDATSYGFKVGFRF